MASRHLQLLTTAILFGQALGNACTSQLHGSCVNYKYSDCLLGEKFTFSGCSLNEICCYPDRTPAPVPAIHPDQCGLSTPQTVSTKIVGGTIAKPGEFPWQVSLENFGQHVCGGILIDRNWVLTAAHCFRQNHYPSTWNVVVGENDRAFVEGQEKIIQVDTLFVHSQFDPNVYSNDIAMMKLTEDVSVNGFIRPVCLPDKMQSFEYQTCVITGWGAAYSGGHGTHALYKASVPLLPQAVCTYLLNVTIPDTMVCAGLKQGGVDTCQGDSGGPLVCNNDGIFQVAGIVSWGYSCAEKYTPGVYTNVPKYIDWINSVLSAYDSSSPIIGRREARDKLKVKVYSR